MTTKLTLAKTAGKLAGLGILAASILNLAACALNRHEVTESQKEKPAENLAENLEPATSVDQKVFDRIHSCFISAKDDASSALCRSQFRDVQFNLTFDEVNIQDRPNDKKYPKMIVARGHLDPKISVRNALCTLMVSSNKDSAKTFNKYYSHFKAGDKVTLTGAATGVQDATNFQFLLFANCFFH